MYDTLYVDDLVIVTKHENVISEFKMFLIKRFEMSDKEN